MCIMCTNDCSQTLLIYFLNFTQRKSVKRINISCKITFGFKYTIRLQDKLGRIKVSIPGLKLGFPHLVCKN